MLMKDLKCHLLGLAIAICFLSGFPAIVFAQFQEYSLKISDHKFDPAQLEIPAGQKVKIMIENHDATAEEFESYDLHREKVVSGHGKIIIYIGPLKPGTYKYFGEYHQGTAQGAVIVK